MTQQRRGFSSRLDWDLRPNRLAGLLRRKRQAAAVVLDLTESNPTQAGLDYDEAEILGALSDPGGLVYDPQPAGLSRAREAVAGYYRSRRVQVDPGRILLTASTSEAYAYLFKLLADPGDEVLAPRPSYPLLEFLAAMESVRIRHYPLSYQEGWWLDVDALRSQLTSRTRAVVVVNPNNPTGSFLKREELAPLVRLCAERNLALISDEVFYDYAFQPDRKRASTLAGVDAALCFTLSGLSKVVGLPQMKLGWIVAGGPEALRLQAFERLELVADTYLSAGTPVQLAAARLLGLRSRFQSRVMRRLAGNLETVRNAVAGDSICRLLQVEGGWYAIVQLPQTRSEEEWALALLEHDDVLVEPGFFYDFTSEAYVVVSLLTPPEVFEEGVSRLVARAREF